MEEVEFSVDVSRDDTLLDDDKLDQVTDKIAYSSDDDGSDCSIPDVCIDLPEFVFEQPKNATKVLKKPSRVDEVMKKSILGPDFERLHSVPLPKATKKAERLERKRERGKTKGAAWYNLPAQEITEEVKNDLDLLKMRSVLDPKRFYKNNDISHTPKYFQVGTVVEAPADYYNSRIPKGKRKKTFVDELLADEEARAYQRKKFKAIIGSRRHAGAKKGNKKNKEKKNNK